MAEQRPRGWLWTEKEQLPQGLADLKRRSETVGIQLARFASALPDLVAEARPVGKAFQESAKPLVALWQARKNKSLPLSPQEATAAVETARLAEQAWLMFLKRDDVRKAIQGVNREIRGQKKQLTQVVASARGQAQAKMEAVGFREQLQESVARGLEIAITATAMMWEPSADANGTLLRRLAMIHFVHLSFHESRARANRLTAFLHRTRAPSIHEVVAEAAMNVVQDELASIGRRQAIFGSPGKLVEIYIGSAAETLLNSVRSWRAEGIGPDQIGRGYFEILGFDYSLESHPD